MAVAHPPSAAERPLWLRHLHWLLILALLPLAWSVLRPSGGERDFGARLRETLERATPEERQRVLYVLGEMREGKESEDVFWAVLPGHRLAGALLPRHTGMHWLFAAGAAVLFMAFFLLLATHGTARPQHLLAVAVFTATVGIGLLLLFQLLADWSRGVWLTGGSTVVLLFYIVKFIGFSYRAALDPANGFFPSLLGFTFGVGFCEEVAKALPLLGLYRLPNDQTWRGALVWGLASGAAFGIAEGIMYAGSYYNGISGPETYLVRFLSCVALHAVWTGSVGITINRKQALLQRDLTWYEFLGLLLRIVSVPMVLHGLYDTLLKKHMTGWALGIAVLSFLYLAWQISRLHSTGEEQTREAIPMGFP